MDKETITVLEWVDSANLSRPKKNLARDFSDGGRYFNNISISHTR